jgi:hypothetical protein
MSTNPVTAPSAADKAAFESGKSLPELTGAGEIEIAGRRYITPRRLSRLLGVTERTLARWDARRIAPPKITIGKTVLFDVAKLPDWLAAREAAPIRNARHQLDSHRGSR